MMGAIGGATKLAARRFLLKDKEKATSLSPFPYNNRFEAVFKASNV
ncbi:hypothetical protein NDK43_25530 [Neobacillus pocheonensis]|uniref:Uncharacterized protein n=1 Tax=Neobacillus pocheonensis TaxID=363869 RepID=A0ABT0WFL7_9BACI|nr:hypothetical protein [Neobacillus pocheonensis]